MLEIKHPLLVVAPLWNAEAVGVFFGEEHVTSTSSVWFQLEAFIAYQRLLFPFTLFFYHLSSQMLLLFRVIFANVPEFCICRRSFLDVLPLLPTLSFRAEWIMCEWHYKLWILNWYSHWNRALIMPTQEQSYSWKETLTEKSSQYIQNGTLI